MALAWSRAESRANQRRRRRCVASAYDVQGRAPRRRDSPKLGRRGADVAHRTKSRTTDLCASRSVLLTVREWVVHGCRFGLISLLPSFTRRNSSSSCVFRSVHTALESACRTSFWNNYGAALQTLHLRPNTSSAGFQSHSSKLAVDTSCLDSCSLSSTVRWTPNWLF